MIIFSLIVDKNLNIYVIYSSSLHLWVWIILPVSVQRLQMDIEELCIHSFFLLFSFVHPIPKTEM